MICGADNWVEIKDFGKAKRGWFDRFLKLPNGIPSHDTFGRVFAMLDPDRFAVCFTQWVKSVSRLVQGEVLAIDDKTLRRSHDRNSGKEAIHLVSAWASENPLVLGQTKVEGKSNEITAIPQLLKMLDVSECIFTIDAMGCQRNIDRQIVESGAAYLLAVPTRGSCTGTSRTCSTVGNGRVSDRWPIPFKGKWTGVMAAGGGGGAG